ncbi:MAG TPA: hypothetical protein VFM49_08190 [Chloroflexia bacterium]|nr:hypothetical protein [Chloroflexia bacterium]
MRRRVGLGLLGIVVLVICGGMMARFAAGQPQAPPTRSLDDTFPTPLDPATAPAQRAGDTPLPALPAITPTPPAPPTATPAPAPPLVASTTPAVPAKPPGAVAPTDPAPAAMARVADPQLPGVLWFSQTGHTLRGGFRAYWEQHGGLAQFGYPLSEEFQEYVPQTGHAYTVQYFERNRFEWHPENAGQGNEFLLGLLGLDVTQGAVFPTSAPVDSTATTRYFPETRHSLGGEFLAYWQQHGGLAQFGYPVSEEVLEQSPAGGRVYLVQYFERNRFELHPEHRGTADEVQLGLLGVDVLRRRGWLP